MLSRILLIFVILIQLSKITLVHSEILNVYYLESGDEKIFIPEQRRLGFYSAEIQIYCYKGIDKTIWRYFQTVHLQLDIENDDYTKYEGSTPEIVKAHYDEHKSIFSFNFLTFKKTRIKLNPFNQTCIGIDTLQQYKIRLNVVRADVWKISYFVIGFLIFTFAASLSKNSIFYYLAGITLGVCASFLILVFLAGKLFPRRPIMYGVFIGGWTIGYYIIKLLLDNLQLILISYYSYVMWYILITGFISFIICYRMGPPTNQRSKNLIKWSLQFLALILIFLSTELEECSTIAIILIILQHYFPWKYFRILFGKFCYRWFPPKRRFLTLEEYEQQGIRETKKALGELRQYCSSPECKQWKVMSSLKNPKRFASFVEGESHLMDEEIFDHDETRVDETDSELSDDETNTENDERNGEISEDEVPTKILQRKPSPYYLNGNKPLYEQPIMRTRSTYRTRYQPIERKVLYSSYQQQEYSDEDDRE